MGQAWRSQFTEEELAQIEAALADSIIGRMARLLDQAERPIPDRSQLRHSDSLPQRYPNIRQLEEGG
jgi:hypothetical protein